MQVINPVVGKLPSDPSPLNGNQIAGAFLAAEEAILPTDLITALIALALSDLDCA